jgi:hypothetical protein
MDAVPSLTSGLYIFEAPSEVATTKQFYVVYWPEDTTWDDDAMFSVSKNRVTFIRQATQHRLCGSLDLRQPQISY